MGSPEYRTRYGRSKWPTMLRGIKNSSEGSRPLRNYPTASMYLQLQSMALGSVERVVEDIAMLASVDAERTRMFVMTDAEVRTTPPNSSIVQEFIFSYLNEKLPGLPHNIFDVDTYDHDSGMFAVERIQRESLLVWSSRFTEPDLTVAGRSWTLELSLWEGNGRKKLWKQAKLFFSAP